MTGDGAMIRCRPGHSLAMGINLSVGAGVYGGSDMQGIGITGIGDAE